MKIESTIALVTGGAKGLGLTIANHLCDFGATVIVADRDDAALSTLPGHLKQIHLDVTDPDATSKAVTELTNRYGNINVLVNNAGVIFSEPFVNITQSDKFMHDYKKFREVVAVNLDSVFIVTSAVVEALVKRRSKGIVVNISSISACGNEGQTAYSAAKSGVNAMTVTWSKELGRWGIRCNAVAPGFIDTDSTRAALTAPTLKYIQSHTPLRRLGTANEVAQAVAALIENDFINGAIVPVDGGLTL